MVRLCVTLALLGLRNDILQSGKYYSVAVRLCVGLSLPGMSIAKRVLCCLQDVDIKRQGAASAYAFVQYTDISSVVHALREMEGEHIGANKIKVRTSNIRKVRQNIKKTVCL